MMTHKTAPTFRYACMETPFFLSPDPPWFPGLWRPLAGQLETSEIHSVEQASPEKPWELGWVIEPQVTSRWGSDDRRGGHRQKPNLLFS